MARVAPNLSEKNVIASAVFSPLDIERSCINMVGEVTHQHIRLSSSGAIARPGIRQVQHPNEGLAACGASSHSGGAIAAAPATTLQM